MHLRSDGDGKRRRISVGRRGASLGGFCKAVCAALAVAFMCGSFGCRAAEPTDEKLLAAARASRGELERYTQWVERTLRGHDSQAARAEVLFSPLRLDDAVLDARVSVGEPEQRYALREGEAPPPEEGTGWTKLTGGRFPHHARWGRVNDPQADGETPCVWLRVDARSAGVVHGFRVWVAYRAR